MLPSALYLYHMTFEQCELWLKNRLGCLYDAGEATAITDWVLEEYTGTNKSSRRVKAEQVIDSSLLLDVEHVVDELLKGRPLQYVLGYADFYGLRFKVNESVLIPRPETEELIDWIIKDYKRAPNILQILDIGTGSGCIPISIKKHLPNVEISSVDISAAALEIASQNAIVHQAKVRFSQLNFLEESCWQQMMKYNIIASNPPYIPQKEKADMHQNVTGWEPATALFVPNERPLLFYEKIALFSKTHLYNSGTIYLETHKDFAAAVQRLFIDEGYTAELKKDIHGNERMVKAIRS